MPKTLAFSSAVWKRPCPNLDDVSMNLILTSSRAFRLVCGSSVLRRVMGLCLQPGMPPCNHQYRFSFQGFRAIWRHVLVPTAISVLGPEKRNALELSDHARMLQDYPRSARKQFRAAGYALGVSSTALTSNANRHAHTVHLRERKLGFHCSSTRTARLWPQESCT